MITRGKITASTVTSEGYHTTFTDVEVILTGRDKQECLEGMGNIRGTYLKVLQKLVDSNDWLINDESYETLETIEQDGCWQDNGCEDSALLQDAYCLHCLKTAKELYTSLNMPQEEWKIKQIDKLDAITGIFKDISLYDAESEETDNDCAVKVQAIAQDGTYLGVVAYGDTEIWLLERYGHPEQTTYVKTNDISSGKWEVDHERHTREEIMHEMYDNLK